MPDPAAAGSTTREFKLELVDPLFAIVVGLAFTEGLTKADWFRGTVSFGSSESLLEAAGLLFGFLTVLFSWVGYHRSTLHYPLKGSGRFYLDIIILVLYAFVILFYKSPFAMAVVCAIIFVLFVLWDLVRTHEVEPAKRSERSRRQRPTILWTVLSVVAPICYSFATQWGWSRSACDWSLLVALYLFLVGFRIHKSAITQGTFVRRTLSAAMEALTSRSFD